MEHRRARFDYRHKPARDLFPGDLVPVTYLVEDVPVRRRKRVWRSFGVLLGLFPIFAFLL